MLLWLAFALISAVVLAVLVRPLLGRQGQESQSPEGGGAVYLDQLSEIEAEQSRGLIAGEEAELARREIARRLLASEADAQTRSGGSTPTPFGRPLATLVGLGLLVAVPVAAISIYLANGRPGLPGQPFASRPSQTPTAAKGADPQLAKLVAAVEQRLKTNPDDGRGWDVIAPVYLRLGRFGEAADAFERAHRLLGPSVPRLSGFVEAIMLANDGRVTVAARGALETLIGLDPGHVQARFWLGYAKEQDGQIAEAARDYQALLRDAPAEANWVGVVKERLAAVQAKGAASAPGPATGQADGRAAAEAPKVPSGPTAADVEAAQQMTPSQRQAMINGMISSLEAKLEKNGRDLAGWQRLIRSLTVMGRNDDAKAALVRARRALADEPSSLTVLAELARSLGIGS